MPPHISATQRVAVNGETSPSDDLPEPHRYTREVLRHQTSPMQSAQRIVSKLRADTHEHEERLEDVDKFWKLRREKLVAELAMVVKKRHEEECRQEGKEGSILPSEDADEPAGPKCLLWVDGSCYSATCMCVILANLTSMGLEAYNPDLKPKVVILDHVFLAWYLSELVLKTALHQGGLFIGDLRTVWWNWLDSIIVVSGIIDQWVMPWLHSAAEEQGSALSMNSLRSLRLLRLMRIMRAVKVVKLLVHSDLSWTEGHYFQSFIMCVIAFNTVILGLELDIPWNGWFWIEQVLLIIYVFELLVRWKRSGVLQFFIHPRDWVWNCLDFVIVAGAVSGQWLLPAYRLIHKLVTQSAKESGGSNGIIALLRILRLFRILRLVRLLRAIKPLYCLLIGITEAVSALLWVMVLTFIVLYAFAILATSLVGHGIIFGDDAPPPSERVFTTVPESMFLLFRLMNDDQSVVDPLITSLPARYFFVAFMVVTNWSILAILTSVMSESMLSATRVHNQHEVGIAQDRLERQKADVLISMLDDIDVNHDRRLGEKQFMDALSDKSFAREFCQTCDMNMEELINLFSTTCDEDEAGEKSILIEDFIEKLQEEGNQVSEFSISRLEYRIRRVEERLDRNIMTRLDELSNIAERFAVHKQLPGSTSR